MITIKHIIRVEHDVEVSMDGKELLSAYLNIDISKEDMEAMEYAIGLTPPNYPVPAIAYKVAILPWSVFYYETQGEGLNYRELLVYFAETWPHPENRGIAG